MLGKISKKSLINGFHKAKNFIGHAYNTTKNVLSNVDNGVKLFKHVYSVAHPLIDHYSGKTLNNGIMGALNGYDNIKSQAMNTHNEIEGNINTLKNSLAKKRYNFNIA
jgi:hypothetical protein